jgi:hypothetical protein
MNEQHARELFLEHHRGSLSATDESALRAFLAAHPALEREFDEFAATLNALDSMPVIPPSSRLRANLLATIDAEKRAIRGQLAAAKSAPRTVSETTSRWPGWIWSLRVGLACVLLAVGYFVGTRAPVSPQLTDDRVAQRTASTPSEIAELRRRVEEMTQLVSYSLQQQPQRATSDRLKTVLASARLENPNDKVINELIGSLALDPSSNVRLTALEALYAHADQEIVRAGVLSCLPREQSPLVQIAMIDFLVAARERTAASTLDGISRSNTTDQEVRVAAMRALNQL